MKKLLFPFAMLLALGVSLVSSNNRACAQNFIDLDLTQVAPALRPAFIAAEQFWESRVVGYRADLPADVRQQLPALSLIHI